MSSGWLADYLIRKKMLSVTNTRKLFTTIAHVGPSITLISASYAGTQSSFILNVFVAGFGKYSIIMKVI